MTDRTSAECFPLSEFLLDEMEARGWTRDDLHDRINADPATHCAVDLCLAVNDPGLILGRNTAATLARVFGGEAEYFLNLDKAWRDWKADQKAE